MDNPPVKVEPGGEGTSIVQVTVHMAAPQATEVEPTAAHLIGAIQTVLGELAKRIHEPEPTNPKHPTLLRWVKRIFYGVGVVSLVIVSGSVLAAHSIPGDWWLQVAVFAAVATVPQWMVEVLASLATKLGRDLLPTDHPIGFENPGAFLGLAERVLFLGALVASYPEFIAVWFVFKGIAGYRVGLPEKRERRTFQLFLLNSAVSLAGVALGWLVWWLLDLPTLPR